MKSDQYLTLKKNINEMNNINDEINFIEWNNEDGPKFDSVEEMKQFYEKVSNNEFDYFFAGSDEEKIDLPENKIIESYEYFIDDYFFYIYTFQRDNDYITYMSVKNIVENDVLNNLCGNKVSNRELARDYFETLKNDITTNNIEDIIKGLIVRTDKTLIQLKNRLAKLTSEN